MTRPYIPDIVEVDVAARLIRANVFTHGQRVGSTSDGNPVWAKHNAVVVDLRPESRYQ
jgi:hypothetical protein